MRLDEHGWLVEEAGGARVEYHPTVRITHLDGPGPLGCVWHATGGVGGRTFTARLCERIRTFRAGVDRPASFHVAIARDGVAHVCAPFSVGTWHVGRAGTVAERFVGNVNRATVGIELENAGPLRELEGGVYAWPYFLNPGAPRSERRPDPRLKVAVTRAARGSDGRLYDAFTKAQAATAEELLEAAVLRYGWDRESSACAHAQFAAPRKADPGPLWMTNILPRLLDRVFGPSGHRGSEASGGGTVS